MSELVNGVAIALGRASLGACPALDANGDSLVEIDELVASVDNALRGCPLEGTPRPTPTAAINQPPVLPPPAIYRAYPGFEIDLPIPATDPEGGAVHCTAAALPAGAAFDEPTAVLRWTPADDQLGPFYVPVECADAATPPLAATGQLVIAVAPPDGCAMPSCDPATGCTTVLPPVSESCCTAPPTVRVAEPVAGCPAGRVLFVGQNTADESFGRLQNCDIMKARNFQQSGAEVQFHIETRCVNSNDQVRLRARMESTAALHPVLFDIETRAFFLSDGPGEFASQRGLRFPVTGGGPFFDLEGADANLTVTLTDADGIEVSQALRVRLTFTPRPDLPDVDPPN